MKRPKHCALSTTSSSLSFAGPPIPTWRPIRNGKRPYLEATYDQVDYISLHMYFENYEKNTAEYLALPEKLERYIGTVGGVIDYVKAKKRVQKRM